MRLVLSSLAAAIVLVAGGPAWGDEDVGGNVTSNVDRVQVRGHGTDRGATPGRASSRVDRRELEETLPRSTPDALRYEPGISVQQSAHGQGSAYIRGRTGQQTVLLFDGIRLNTSTWRQGPNQYFFTIDSRVLQSLDVLRGGASTLYGSDAIGGVVDAKPIEPVHRDGPIVRPRALVRYASADRDASNRFQLELRAAPGVRALLGVGFRSPGLLESAGPVRSPATGQPPLVPTFAKDGRTQLGTGFRELTTDARLVLDLSSSSRLLAAFYGYRQFDSPRTDQCPAPYAPRDECLTYDEQFRSLGYLRFEGDLGPAARYTQVTLSYQRQHERRTLRRPTSFVQNGGRDSTDTLGIALRFGSGEAPLGPVVDLDVKYGLDVYADHVDSSAWTEFVDLGSVVPLSRGQYLAGSRYAQGGAFVDGELEIARKVFLRMGGRAAFAAADARADEASGTANAKSSWWAPVGHVGVEWLATPALAFLATYDHSWRAPNLDDLTSRQQSGPGFQFENATLVPELANTFDLGTRVTLPWLEADAWAFASLVENAMTRSPRALGECPPATPQCAASWARFQLVNARDPARMLGVELSARAFLPHDLTLRTAASFAHGTGPHPADAAAGAPSAEVPLSRVPPLHGFVEARWGGRHGLYVAAAFRWALTQDRLAPTDLSDARIPTGGTPGFGLLDLRVGYRLRRELIVSAVFENVTDVAYRQHGSSVNGPGRGVILSLEAGL